MLKYYYRYKKLVLLFVAGACSSVFQWITISVMTKVFSTETVGIYSGAVAVITPIVTFADLSFRSMQVTDTEGRFKIGDVFIVKKVTALLGSIIIMICFLLKGYSKGTLFIACAILISKIVHMFSDAAYGKLIRCGAVEKYALSVAMVYFLSSLFFSVTAVLSKSIYLSIALYTIPFILVLIFYDIRNVGGAKKLCQYSNDPSTYKYIVKMCLPLAIVQTINTLYDSIPKLFIEGSFGKGELGIFSATSYMSLAGGIVVTAITTAYATELAQMIKRSEKKKYVKTIGIEAGVIAAFCLILILALNLWGRPLVSFLYTAEYAEHTDVLIMLVVAMSFNFISRVMGTACTAARLNKQQLYVAITCVLFLFVTSMFFIPRYGMPVAAVLMSLTYILKSILLLGVFIRKTKKDTVRVA